MKKKSLVSMVVALALTATVMVGATLAYLTDKGEAVNTFTIGKVKIDLREDKWDPEEGKDMYPGKEVSKDPAITNTGKNTAKVLIHVDGMEEMADKFVVKNGDTEGFNTTDWVYVKQNEAGDWEEDTSVVTLQDGYYAYKYELEAKDTTNALFTKVQLKKEVTEGADKTYEIVAKYKVGNELYSAEELKALMKENEDTTYEMAYVITGVANEVFDSYEAAEEYVLSNFGAEAGYVFDLKLTAYAIQAEGMEDYDWVKQVIAETTTDAE